MRSGTDIVFLGALINWVLSNERYFKEYVAAYTNASYLVSEDFKDTEDLDGLFSGYDADRLAYDSRAGLGHGRGPALRRRKGHDSKTRRDPATPALRAQRAAAAFRALHAGDGRRRLRHAAPPFEKIANLLAENSGRERTTAFAYAVGWTQHTIGVQYIRTAGILQMLLGNMGRPGGGIMALRGHANIQGATDIPTLYDLLPGYLPMPSAHRDEQTFARVSENQRPNDRLVVQYAQVHGLAAQGILRRRGDHRKRLLLRVSAADLGDHSLLPTQIAMKDGNVKGYFVHRAKSRRLRVRTPSSRSAALESARVVCRHRQLRERNRVVLATRGRRPRDDRDRSVLPTRATVLEKDGTMRQTNRMLQSHDKAVEPAGESKSDTWYFTWFAKRLKELYANSTDPKDRPILDLTWDYPHDEPHERERGEPSTLKVLARDQRLRRARQPDAASKSPASPTSKTTVRPPAAPGFTPACAPTRKRIGRATATQGRLDRAELGLCVAGEPAHALQPRVGRSRRKALERAQEVHVVGRGGKEVGRSRRSGLPGSPKRPTRRAKPGATGIDAHAGSDPFIMQLDGRSADLRRRHAQRRAVSRRTTNRWNRSCRTLSTNSRTVRRCASAIAATTPTTDRDADYPYVLTTYRLTEHSGIMTRYVPWLAELQPAAVRRDRPGARGEEGHQERRLGRRSRPRVGEIEARALVSGRMRPLRLGQRQARASDRRAVQLRQQVRYTSGDSAGQLIPLAMDPNVSIHEAKTITCNIRPGRRAAYGQAPPSTGAENEPVRGQRRRRTVSSGRTRSQSQG